MYILHVESVIDGLMASVIDSGSGSPGLSPGQGHCVVFLGTTLYSLSASLHSGVQMGIGEFNLMLGVTL